MEEEPQDEEEKITSPWYSGKNSDFEDDVVVRDFEAQFDNVKMDDEENLISKESEEIKVYRSVKAGTLQHRGLADAKPYNDNEIDDTVVEDDEENVSDMRFNKLREEMADVPDLDVEEEEEEEEEEVEEMSEEEKEQEDYRNKVLDELDNGNEKDDTEIQT